MHIEKKSYNYLQIIVDFDDVAKPEKRRRQGGYDDLAVFAHEVTLARFDPAPLDLESLDPVIPVHISVIRETKKQIKVKLIGLEPCFCARVKFDVLEKIDLGALGGLSGAILDLAPKG